MKNLVKLSLVSLFLLGACNSTPTSSGSTSASPSTGSSRSTSASPSTGSSSTPVNGEKVAFATVKTVITQRCATCHSTKASDPSFGSPAGNVAFDTDQEIKDKSDRIKVRAVDLKTMPMGNKTNMTDAERALIGTWVEQGASIN